jgi:hypothetical protein
MRRSDKLLHHRYQRSPCGDLISIMKPYLVYLCDWLPPDFGAVGQYVLHFARQRAGLGNRVVLIGLSSRGTSIETETHGAGSLEIHRLHAPFYDKLSFGARMLWTLKTNFRLVLAAAPFARRASEIHFTGSPPFLLHFVFPLNLIWRAQLVYRLTDFWPECLMAELTKVPLWLRLLWNLTCTLRRRIGSFEVLGHDQRKRLESIGIASERMALVRDPSPVSFTGNESPLQVPEELDGRIILLYSGNWGIAHEIDTFVEGYLRHHREGSGRIGLWLNAVGSRADQVERHVRAHGLPVARTRPIALTDLPRLLVTPHAHLITLKDAFVGYVLPSKVHACIASGRPILFVGSGTSDIHMLCAEAEPRLFYKRVAVGDAAGLYAALEELAQWADTGARSAPANQTSTQHGSTVGRAAIT